MQQESRHYYQIKSHVIWDSEIFINTMNLKLLPVLLFFLSLSIKSPQYLPPQFQPLPRIRIKQVKKKKRKQDRYFYANEKQRDHTLILKQHSPILSTAVPTPTLYLFLKTGITDCSIIKIMSFFTFWVSLYQFINTSWYCFRKTKTA